MCFYNKKVNYEKTIYCYNHYSAGIGPWFYHYEDFAYEVEGNLKLLALSEIYYVNLAGVEDGDYIGSYSVFTVSVEIEVTLKIILYKKLSY